MASVLSVAALSITPSHADEPTLPPGLDPDVLAVQLTGRLAMGELREVTGGKGDWVLFARAASTKETAPGKFELRERSNPFSSLTALVRWQSPEHRSQLPLLQVLATTPSVTQGTAAQEADEESVGGPDASPPPDTVPCIDPEADQASDRDGGGYPDIGEFRWVQLSKAHRVLAARVSRSEGYAGGGGSFEAEVLLEPRQGQLVPVACYAISRDQMFGGSWRPDGTREHPESHAAWTLRAVSGAAWPRLHLRPSTRHTPGAFLRWNSESGHYVQERAPASPATPR